MIEKAGTQGRYGFLCPIVFLIIFFGVALFMLGSLLNFIDTWYDTGGGNLPGPGPEIMLLVFPIFLICPIAMIIGILRQFLIVAPRKAEETRIEREAFLREIGMERDFTPRDDFRADSFKKSSRPYFCKTCGSRTSAVDDYCPNCGSSLK